MCGEFFSSFCWESFILIKRHRRALGFSVKILLNGKERGEEDRVALFAAADQGFEIVRFILPADAMMAVIEVVWNGRSYNEEDPIVIA